MTAKNDHRQRPVHPSADQDGRLRFPNWRRLRSSLDFSRIYALRNKAGDRNLLIFAARNDLGWTRIGLSISRRHGNSVVRHRIRRLLREAYRLEQFAVPEGLDLILIPGRNSSATTLEEYRASLVRLTRRLDYSLAGPDNDSQPSP